MIMMPQQHRCPGCAHIKWCDVRACTASNLFAAMVRVHAEYCLESESALLFIWLAPVNDCMHRFNCSGSTCASLSTAGQRKKCFIC